MTNSKDILQRYKGAALVALIILILSALHYQTSSGDPFLHDLYRRLYYLPLILASLWFGLRGGLFSAFLISLFFLPHIFHRWGEITLMTYDALFEIILYFIVAGITGGFVELDRKRKLALTKLQEEMASLISKSLKKEPGQKPAKLQTATASHFGTLVGEAPAMQKIYELILKLSKAPDANVLVTGESGTGKELVAWAIHQEGSRKERPFVAINCAAIPDSLLESELFGYKKGAFTGADLDKPGKLQLADGGTLFLDEIGTMSFDLQAKLLRVIEDKLIQPVGSSKSVKVDFRLISATNEDLEERVRRKLFRSDLYYRLHVVNIALPPLRHRQEDIPLLISHFLKKHGRPDLNIAADTLKKLQNYPWPGNIRELENVIQRAITLNEGHMLLTDDLPKNVQGGQAAGKGFKLDLPPEGIRLEELEKSLLQAALAKTNGNQTKSADLLGLSRPAFIYRMEKHGLKALPDMKQ
ncbi:MAG: sigma-54 dependent transcriptional regulator [Candidatus Margulisiibacteriota bacterium]|jgi:two-component system NtrC family response regulator